MQQIKELLDTSKRCNVWLRIDKHYLNVYVRITERCLNGIMHRTLDVATVEVDRRHQCQGHFTNFLTEIEKLAEEYRRVVYVESICRDFLFDFLDRRGYKVMTPDTRSLAKSFK